MDDAKLNAIVDAIVRELKSSGAVKTARFMLSTCLLLFRRLYLQPSAVPVKPRAATSTANYYD